ncbi:MAG: hypothetical protein ACT4QF_09645 [Sporichthyaceae bacterium]
MDLARLLDPEGPHARVAAVAVLGAMLVGGCSLTDGDGEEPSAAAVAAAAAVDEQRTAQLASVVACDLGGPETRLSRPTPPAGSEPTTAAVFPASTARGALEDLRVQGLDWTEQRLTTSTYRYTASVAGRVRAAVDVVRSGAQWTWEASAFCDQAELPESTDASAGVVVWTNAQGARVSTRAVHSWQFDRHRQQCFGERVRIVAVDGVEYVSDPLHSFQGTAHGSYRDAAPLPADAVDTGLRSDGAALWRGKDRNSVYLVEPTNTRRLPRLKSGPPGFC